jgi:aspartyl-tRNA(Asn)/glutamyl-tRNA(Gln) amidotransferase subunit A
VTIREAAAALRKRRISAVELTMAAVSRIDRLNGSLHAFITVMAPYAMDRARVADAELGSGHDRGPLHGIPIAVKDVFATRGVRTTGGSRVFEALTPNYNATVVDRLEKAGAVLIGKLNLHELAYGITSDNPFYGTVHNP